MMKLILMLLVLISYSTMNLAEALPRNIFSSHWEDLPVNDSTLEWAVNELWPQFEVWTNQSCVTMIRDTQDGCGLTLVSINSAQVRCRTEYSCSRPEAVGLRERYSAQVSAYENVSSNVQIWELEFTSFATQTKLQNATKLN